MSIRLLISGCGGAGSRVAEAAVKDGRGEIVGLVDPGAKRYLEKMQELYSKAAVGPDLKEVLSTTRPDAVVVAGPDHLHANQAILALEQGCHVLVEKPLATTVADARRIMSAEAASGKHVMTDHTMRYVYPSTETAERARAGDVGRIFFVQGDYIHDMWDYYNPEGKSPTLWRVDGENPQNILLGGGCHPIDLMLWTVDSPVTSVFAYASKLSAPAFPADDCYLLVIRFEDETLGKVHVTSGCSGHGMGAGFLAVYGTEGTLWNGKLYSRGEEPGDLEDTSGESLLGGHGWGGAVPQFLDLAEGKIPNPIPASDGARTVAVCEAALKSVVSGQPEVPETI